MKRFFRFFKKVFRRIFKKQAVVETDPFAELEKRGLKIAASSKKIMHSPWGIDRTFPWLIEIGEDCLISTNVVIMAHDASTALPIGYTKIGRVSIGNHVFIGQGSTILCGVSIGDNAIIGARSLVNKDVPANCVYGGNPAKFICTFEEYREKKKEELENVPLFEHNWYYWSRQASMEEKNQMADQMKESKVAYIKSDIDAIQ